MLMIQRSWHTAPKDKLYKLADWDCVYCQTAPNC